MHHSLSLWSAIRININIMLGLGLFINTVYLARMAGPWGAFSYGLVGLILLPLIITFARLVELHPQGGFYSFGAHEINPFAGFLSAWIYFTGKLASAALMVHASTIVLRGLVPGLAEVPHVLLDIVIIGVFAVLNLGNLRVGSIMQNFFFGAKMIPIIAVIGIAVAYHYGLPTLTFDADVLKDLIGTIPLVLYAAIGFESACALSGRLENARVNGPRAIIISYSVLMVIYCLFQAALYWLCGEQLATLNSFAEVFDMVAQYVPTSMHPFFAWFLSISVACSALGGAYGILFANMWNLHALAEHEHLWGARWFKYLSMHKVPVWCVVAEFIICACYIVVGSGVQLPLQQISGLGSVIAYTMSIGAAYYAKKRGALNIPWFVLVSAGINCLMLMALCGTYLIQGGSYALYLFALLIILGISMFWSTSASTVLYKPYQGTSKK